MAEENATLATFYENWQLYQTHLQDAIAPLTADQLTLRAAPHVRSLGQIAAHIIAARVYWFIEFLGETDADALPLMDWDERDAPDHSAADLVRGLDVSWKLMADALARWNAADMQKTFPNEWRGNHYDLSRGWVIWHLLEHDLHHGGEISLTLGMNGLRTPDV